MKKFFLGFILSVIGMLISTAIFAQDSEPYDNKIILIADISEYEIDYMRNVRAMEFTDDIKVGDDVSYLINGEDLGLLPLQGIHAVEQNN
ncbi:MAG: hypothetical protein JXR91_09325 [Deltaproteobacteria bacterium]|nr:hypothetical protein [Deltaproteobacteria bacterium]